MSAPILVDDAKIQAQVTKIKTCIASGEDLLTHLKTEVDAFLSPTGGLYLPQSSTSLTDEFTQAKAQLDKAIQSLDSFGTMFTNIGQEIHKLDQSIASSMHGKGGH
jgi:hypothetical protein